MVSKARARRIALRIQEILAELLQREVSDPRLKNLTVTGVEVDRELAYATIYVSGLEAGQDQDAVMQALAGARGFLRSELAGQIQLRSFPQLRFQWDTAAERGARIEELLRQIGAEAREDRDPSE